jgi:hypothetical protein
MPKECGELVGKAHIRYKPSPKASNRPHLDKWG